MDTNIHVAEGRLVAASDTNVLQWINTLDSSRRKEQVELSDKNSNISTVFPTNDAPTFRTSATSDCHPSQGNAHTTLEDDDSEDDLEVDLFRAALETCAEAFAARDWHEADSLLREALRLVHHLPKERQSLCNFFDLQYKLAVCAYYTREPAQAEVVLISLTQQPVFSEQQRACVYDATHLLSLLYVRMGQLPRAQIECEKTLVGRRNLLGKRSSPSLESTALMSHIYMLLNNRARAKMCIAMIPETQRTVVIKALEESLGTNIDYLDSPSLSDDRSSIFSKIEGSTKRTQDAQSPSSPARSMDSRCYGPVPTHTVQRLPTRDAQRESYPNRSSTIADYDDFQSVTMTSMSSVEQETQPETITRVTTTDYRYSTEPQVAEPVAAGPARPPSSQVSVVSQGKTLSRKEILERIGCQPRDNLEEAVCKSDHQAFTALLQKEKGFFRSKLRKRVRAERVTALHFAALFGEVDMARRLISSGFDVNEIPFGYSTSLTPLKFAIGARQVEIVELLVSHGAKPSPPDTWSSLAAQLMNRSWLLKTLSPSEKDSVPTRITAIMKILLRQGWDINGAIERFGVTILQQAVTFRTDSYKWDMNLRSAVTSFLCEQGADVFRTNSEGKTPYDMAVASGHQDLIPILGRYARDGRGALVEAVEPLVELPT